MKNHAALITALRGVGEMRECVRYLALILPMAKGFAHQNPFGNNQTIVDDAAEALATLALTPEPNNG